MKPTDFAICVSNYLSKYLPGIQGVSNNTIFSYRDTFSLLILFYETQMNITSDKITLKKFNAEVIEKFLEWLEIERGNKCTTRNNRLAALHAFTKYVAKKHPEIMNEMQEILSIPYKKCKQDSLTYITKDEMQYILSLPDISTKAGLRDATLLSLLYDTGARVQEICDLKVCHIRLENPATIKIHGKGNKVRIVPVMKSMSNLLSIYIEKYGLNTDVKKLAPLFTNRQNSKLTRKGVSYILNKYTNQALLQRSDLSFSKLSPHCFRHSKSMHLLQSGVNLIYIRDILGHVDIKTTEIYARIDSEMKRIALEKAADIVSTDKNQPIWQENKTLLEWLKNLE